MPRWIAGGRRWVQNARARRSLSWRLCALVSPALVGIAAQRAAAPHVRYLAVDAETLCSLADASFDGATCCLALTDFDDLRAVLAATSRVLKYNGWLVVATLHPCFEAPRAKDAEHDGRTVKLVGSYFEEGRWWPHDRTRLFGEIGWHLVCCSPGTQGPFRPLVPDNFGPHWAPDWP